MSWTSPVSIVLRCSPFGSPYARNLPSGEIAAANARFSEGLCVSIVPCGPAGPFGWLMNQRIQMQSRQ